jgi:hypothetical protein
MELNPNLYLLQLHDVADTFSFNFIFTMSKNEFMLN